MAIDRERARAAGYTDEEIDAYEAQQRGTAGGEPPPPPPASADQGDASGINAAEMVMTGLGAVGPFGAGVATAVAAPFAYRGAKAILQKGRDMTRPGTALNPIGGGGPRMPTTTSAPSTRIPINAPVAPAPVAPAPVAPAPAPAPAPVSQPGMVQRVSQMAFDRLSNIAARAAPAVRGGLGAMAALTPGNIGQNYPFPTSGPQRGQEINPVTGRPWTQDELAQYYASVR